MRFRDTGPGVPTFDAYPFPSGSTSVNVGAFAFYDSGQHYAYSDVMLKPWSRFTARFGYLGTFVGGDTLYLNPRQPGGTIAFTYQMPFATIQIDLYKGLSYKTSWNYYGYNEKTPIDVPGLAPKTSAAILLRFRSATHFEVILKEPLVDEQHA
jgi:hypothetical protein